MVLAPGLWLGILIAFCAAGWAQAPNPPLALEAKIPLGPVSGRIDHLAVDPKRQHLFVAELGNDTLGVVDLGARKVMSTMFGLKEPQGIAYEPTTDAVYVANAADGSVRILRGEDLTLLKRLDLGEDADNVRVDVARSRVFVGYGKGELAVIDPKSRAKVGDIRLKAHPESFQIEDSGERAFVNAPDAREIQIVDLVKGEATGALTTQGHRSNFPMALDREKHRVLVVFRSPPRLLVLSDKDGAVVTDVETCADADDLFVEFWRLNAVEQGGGSGRPAEDDLVGQFEERVGDSFAHGDPGDLAAGFGRERAAQRCAGVDEARTRQV